MSEMTGLERCLTVLNGGVADRVPVVPQTFMFAAGTAGIKVRELAHNTSKLVTAQGLGRGDANHRRRPVRDLVPCAPDQARREKTPAGFAPR